jgi:hypothetical protein
MNGKKAKGLRKVAMLMYIKSVSGGKKPMYSLRTLYKRLKAQYMMAKTQGLT